MGRLEQETERLTREAGTGQQAFHLADSVMVM
jgi:hypothetical protein